eukprot:9289-Heterococcus_DN1.PRE.2
MLLRSQHPTATAAQHNQQVHKQVVAMHMPLYDNLAHTANVNAAMSWSNSMSFCGSTAISLCIVAILNTVKQSIAYSQSSNAGNTSAYGRASLSTLRSDFVLSLPPAAYSCNTCTH